MSSKECPTPKVLPCNAAQAVQPSIIDEMPDELMRYRAETWQLDILCWTLDIRLGSYPGMI
jgi:hypothetical protein